MMIASDICGTFLFRFSSAPLHDQRARCVAVIYLYSSRRCKAELEVWINRGVLESRVCSGSHRCPTLYITGYASATCSSGDVMVPISHSHDVTLWNQL